MSIEIRIDQAELQAFRRLMQNLSDQAESNPDSIRGMLLETTRQVANLARDAVAKGYLQSQGAAPHTYGTTLTYAFGKARGAVRDYRAPFPSARPGSRSGTLARNVIAHRMPGKRIVGHVAEIDPNKRYHGMGGSGDMGDVGKSMAWIAAELEEPRPAAITMTKTRRMQVYLMLLYDGRAGERFSPKYHILNNYPVGTIIIQRKPRPIWETVFRGMMKSMPAIVSKSFGVRFMQAVYRSRQGMTSRGPRTITTRSFTDFT